MLLTDGISEEGDSMTLSKDAVANHVTISTVGLGQDVNRAFLEKVAQLAQGKSYFLNDPSGLEQIVLRDVKEHTGIHGGGEGRAPRSGATAPRFWMAWASRRRRPCAATCASRRGPPRT